MTFIGAVNRLEVPSSACTTWRSTTPNGDLQEAIVKRVLYLGFEVRVELRFATGRSSGAGQSNDIEGLKLAPGQAIHITATREKVFA